MGAVPFLFWHPVKKRARRKHNDIYFTKFVFNDSQNVLVKPENKYPAVIKKIGTNTYEISIGLLKPTCADTN